MYEVYVCTKLTKLVVSSSIICDDIISRHASNGVGRRVICVGIKVHLQRDEHFKQFKIIYEYSDIAGYTHSNF